MHLLMDLRQVLVVCVSGDDAETVGVKDVGV